MSRTLASLVLRLGLEFPSSIRADYDRSFSLPLYLAP